MRVYVSVGEEGGFASAARKLNMSPAAVTRAIAALEKFLEVKLLLRTTRNVRFTDAGQQYFNDVKAILLSVSEANDTISGLNKEPQGILTVTASVLFGRMYVMPSIIEYMRMYPKVKVIAHFVDRITNIVEENLDVAIRIGNLPDSSLRAIKVGEVRHLLCASPSYLQQHGHPKHPQDLQQHSVIASNVSTPHLEWKFAQKDHPLTVRINPRLILSNIDAALAAAVEGVGITSLLSYQVKSEVEQGRLEVLMPEFEESPWPIHVLHREDKYGSFKVRAFIEMVAKNLKEHPHLRY